MKTKIKYLISAVSAALLAFPALALAQFENPTGTQLPEGTITDIVTKIMNWLLGLVGVLGVIGFAIAGILYLTAAGDEEKIGTAKNAMMMSIIGVVVALVGLVVLTAVKSMLSGTSSTF